VKAFRMAIHARIPWPKEDERNRLEGEHTVDFWKSGLESSVKMIEANERLMESVKRQNSELRKLATMEAKNLADAQKAMAQHGSAEPVDPELALLIAATRMQNRG
jgi:hypothetical protein